jgi:GNAT superfamily N-acetyltransferase
VTADRIRDGANTAAIRRAVAVDRPVLETLIARSAAGLNGGTYSSAELTAAITHVFGVDSELIVDGTYFVAELDGVPVGCGGWSRRRTLFGGDGSGSRTPGLLDPLVDAARVRAFFVHPDHARRGIACALLARCEAEAAAAGFTRLMLMATLPGVPFYRAAGFVAGVPELHDAGGTPVRFVPMDKMLVEAIGQTRPFPVPQVDQRTGERVA